MSAAATVRHTPGPWIFEVPPADAYTDPDILLDQDVKFWIADTRPTSEVLALVHETVNGEGEANAHLIAAAPALLDDARKNDAALTWLAEQMNSITDNARHWSPAQIAALAQDLRIGIERNQRRIHEVIAKAEGAL